MHRLREALKAVNTNSIDNNIDSKYKTISAKENEAFLTQVPSPTNKCNLRIMNDNYYEEQNTDNKSPKKEIKLDLSQFKHKNKPKIKSNSHSKDKDKDVVSFENGTKYKGHWRNNKPNGKGTIHELNGTTYEGDFENGVKSGYGEEYYEDGSYYKGEWKNGKKHGKGIYKLENGNVFSGKFGSDGKMVGELEKKDGSKIQFRALKRRVGGRRCTYETEINLDNM